MSHTATARTLLALFIALAFVACDDDDKPDPVPQDSMDAGPEPEPDAPDPEPDATEDEPDAPPREPGAVEVEARDCTPTMVPDRAYSATIRWTSYGVPHITGDTLGDVTFGQARAMARDHVCTMALINLRGMGQLARYFGAGDNDRFLNSDLAMRALGTVENAQCGFDSMSPEAREVLAGFTAGYNSYLEEVGPEGLPAECRNADWVRPITPVDLLSTYLRSALRASGDPLTGLIASAQPPEGDQKSLEKSLGAPEWPDMRHLGIGSNGWALGNERTANSKGMLLSNTHFPWEGELRWYESHLTIPDEFNVYGVSLVNAAGVLMGFNEDIAWTHTVSTSSRFSFYLLELVPGDPESYMFDGEPRRMTKQTHEIEVLRSNGELRTETRSMYRSHHGPVLNIPPFGWSDALVGAYRDANENNLAVLEQFLRMDQATSMDEFKSIFSEVHGIPWVNTMAVDVDGNTFYTDGSAVPNLSEAALDGWRQKIEENDLFTTSAASSGIFLFDGSDPVNDWVDEEGSVQPGTVPFSKAPQLERTDYVQNSNDSHWITHPDDLLEGYSPLFGQEAIILPRTTMGLIMLQPGVGSPSGGDDRFTLDELEDMWFDNRTIVAERLLADTVVRCRSEESIEIDGDPIALGPICDVLEAWDGRFKSGSVGATIWREFIGYYLFTADIEIFANPFDKTDPIATPNTLAAAPAEGPDPALVALGMAAKNLAEAGFAIDAPLGEVQYGQFGEERIGMHGGTDFEGAFNIVDYTGGSAADNPGDQPRATPGDAIRDSNDLFDTGYLVNRGSSWIMMMNFTDNGPNARAISTYSQSSVVDSPHFADQSRLFSNSEMRPILFSEDDIAADPNLVTETVSSP